MGFCDFLHFVQYFIAKVAENAVNSQQSELYNLNEINPNHWVAFTDYTRLLVQVAHSQYSNCVINLFADLNCKAPP